MTWNPVRTPCRKSLFRLRRAEVETADATSGGQIGPAVLLASGFLLPVVVPVRMEQVLEREAEAAVLEREREAGEGPVAEVAEPGARVGELGGRVGDDAFRRLVVARPAFGAAAPVQHVALRVLQVGIRSCLPVRASGVGAELRARTVGQRLAVALGRREKVPIGRVGGDDVDEASHHAGAVEQRGRSAHDFDPLGAVGVDRHPVMIRGGGEVAGGDAVLDDEHPVAAESADDRPTRSGAEAAVRDARLVLERLADAARRVGGDVE